jgi:hypothetical protein
MIVWASLAGLVTGSVAFLVGDLTSVLTGAAELAAVTGLFALVCAAEAFN